MIIFICALPQEAKFLRRLTLVQTGKAQIVVSGIGPRNAERATRNATEGSRPSLVVSTGVAGALSPALRIGDVITAGEVIDETTGDRFPCHNPTDGHVNTFGAPPSGGAVAKPSASGTPNSSLATSSPSGPVAILSVARMITSAEEKRSLAHTFAAVAVDMESAAIARVCRERSLPFATVRAISDTAEETIPPAVTTFFDPDGRLRFARIAAELVARPRLLGTLRKLQRQTATACQSLAAFLEAAVWSPSHHTSANS